MKKKTIEGRDSLGKEGRKKEEKVRWVLILEERKKGCFCLFTGMVGTNSNLEGPISIPFFSNEFWLSLVGFRF